MGRTATGERQYQIATIQDNHREIMRRLVAGEKPIDIAREMKISPVTVSYVRNSNLARMQLDRMQDLADMTTIDIRRRVAELAPAAIETMAEIMLDESCPSSVRLKAADSIADRAGLAAVRTHAVVQTSLTEEDLRSLKERAKSAGLCVEIQAETTEAEPVEIEAERVSEGAI